MSTPGLLWAHKYAQRALLSIPALYHRTAIVPWRPTSRLYSTTEEGAPPLIPIVHKRPPKDLQVARQVIDGVESTKDSVLKAYCLAKVRRSAPKRQHASKEPTTDASPYSSYDPDNILNFCSQSFSLSSYYLTHHLSPSHSMCTYIHDFHTPH